MAVVPGATGANAIVARANADAMAVDKRSRSAGGRWWHGHSLNSVSIEVAYESRIVHDPCCLPMTWRAIVGASIGDCPLMKGIDGFNRFRPQAYMSAGIGLDRRHHWTGIEPNLGILRAKSNAGFTLNEQRISQGFQDHLVEVRAGTQIANGDGNMIDHFYLSLKMVLASAASFCS
jgi:hypothetical protein